LPKAQNNEYKEISALEAALELQKRRKARSSLIDFTTYTKHNYVTNWHHELLARKLDQFVSGEIPRLIVFEPPRHGKSELVSRRLPAYIFGKCPSASIISCSYSADLASRMNRDVQRIIDSPEYKSLFPDTALNSSNIRTSVQGSFLRNSDIFEIVGSTGVYRSAGVGGGITGMGCNYGIIDDPIKNREEANSVTYREKVKEWYTSTFYTRLEEGACVLITLTRWHEDDLGGYLLKEMENGGEQWEVLSLPAIATDTRHPEDPREEGDPLWPGKYDLTRLSGIRTVLGPYDFSALYQQSPTPREGGLWKYEHINRHRVSAPPRNLVRIVVGVDPQATSTDVSASTGIVVAALGKDGDGYVLADRSINATPLVWATRAVAAFNDFNADRVIGEVNNGGEMVETVIRTVDPDISYKSVYASHGKTTRAEPIASLYEQGRIHHVGTFAQLEDQMCRWVQGQKSPDRMDALVWALTELIKPKKQGVFAGA
jgi:hypothetical protein